MRDLQMCMVNRFKPNMIENVISTVFGVERR